MSNKRGAYVEQKGRVLNFRTAEHTVCTYFVQVSGNSFKTINNGKPICGTSF